MIDDPELPPVGVIRTADGRACFRVWAPAATAAELDLGGHRTPMAAEARGYHAVTVPRPEVGQRYAYHLDGEPPRPDPASRHQPDGVAGASAIYWPEDHRWDDLGWQGVADRRDLVFSEVHVGTYTPEGTFAAILPRVPALRDLGITAIELMPVGQFPGTRSWGYDGVLPFAPQHSYGGPEGLKRLVEGCHRLGMAVFLDVVYNHHGPEGNVFPRLGPYLTDRYKTDWGSAINYDGRGSDAVRALVLDNARMWIRDYHIDGLRLDAADQIIDRSPSMILAEIAEVAHVEGKKLGKAVHVFAETDLNDAQRFLKRPDQGGYGLDGHWNDDFHHAVHTVLTGETNGYYVDFAGGPKAVEKVLRQGFVNDGSYSEFRGRRHGAPATEFPGDRLVAFTQNHDQVGNRLKSDRYAASIPASALRLAAGLLLLSPRLPLLFMGEEYGETAPFPFFCDFQSEELIKAVREGRKAEFAHFGWSEEPPDPFDPATRASAVLSWDWSAPQRAGLRRLYRDLLATRRHVPALRDYATVKVQLLGSDVLEIGRESEPNVGEVRILFNLSGEARPWPGGSALFRSEAARYGGGPGPPPQELRPHEFAIDSDSFPDFTG